MGFEAGPDMDSGVDTDLRKAVSPDHATQRLVVRTGRDTVCAPASCRLV